MVKGTIVTSSKTPHDTEEKKKKRQILMFRRKIDTN
jgi:hypothetical protein